MRQVRGGAPQPENIKFPGILLLTGLFGKSEWGYAYQAAAGGMTSGHLVA